jgi:hypothetical protein
MMTGNQGRVVSSRLYWAGPLTVLAAVVAVVIVQVIAVAALSPLTQFARMLASSEPAVVTAVLVTGAVFVFAFVAQNADDPTRRFRRIALVVLLLSFLPNIFLAVSIPAAGWRVSLVLAIMHIVAWAVTVTVLPRLVTTTQSNR